MKVEVLVIGGGLSGLSLANRLEHESKKYFLVEARARLGGRIFTQNIGGVELDLGPAWYWPGQPRLEQLVKQLNLDSFDQYSFGDIMYESEDGDISRGLGIASMQGPLRISGGFGLLIKRLAETLESQNYWTDAKLLSLKKTTAGVVATIQRANKMEIVTASKVVLSLPPRLVQEQILFEPNLSETELYSMQAIPTWMAGHAKIVAVFDKPYWRENGMSGDAMSRRGPMVEVHDASPKSGGPYALFGFVGFPIDVRLKLRDDILTLAKQQLVNLFGDSLSNPVSLHIMDWAQEPLTSTIADHTPPRSRPTYGLPFNLKQLWKGDLVLGSTEVASRFGGFLEGAIEAAEMTYDKI
jgi:monoamine oxidase